MISSIREWYVLCNLESELDTISKKHKANKQSEKYKNANNIDRAGMNADMEFEWREVNEKIEGIKTKKILRLAYKYEVPIPNRWPEEENPYWEEGRFGGSYLNLEGYNRIKNGIREERKARIENRLLWVPLVSVLSALLAVFSTFYAISYYQLNENVNVANIGVNLDNAAKVVVLKNYGKLPCDRFNLLSAQIEFAEKPIEITASKAGVDNIYANEDVIFPPKILSGNSDKHIQFLVFVWSYNNGRKGIIKNRVFVRTPSEPYWVPTTRPFVDKSQWNYLMSKINRMQKEIDRLDRV